MKLTKVAEVFEDENENEYARYSGGQWLRKHSGYAPPADFQADIEEAYQKLKEEEQKKGSA